MKTRDGEVCLAYCCLLINVAYCIPKGMIVVEIKATTVAATMRLAHKAGITTFVTGEIVCDGRFSFHGSSFY